MAPQLRWCSPQGRQTITSSTLKLVPQWPNGLYPYQPDLVARILDGQDLLCVQQTGGGKSALFAIPILVSQEMNRNPHLYPNLPMHALPQGVVVTPTKGLAANIVLELKQLGIKALAYCHETITEARKAGCTLVETITECKIWSNVCVDPEHLRDKAWRQISDCGAYRLVYGCTDEAHLVNLWGAGFRPDFRHIGGFFRGRLPSSMSVSALSATLQPGAATQSVCSSLGMLGDNFYEHRSSNERPNTWFIMLPLQNGFGSHVFPQLLFYLNSGRKAAIHCRTIKDVLRVFLYLWRSLPPGPRRLRWIKMYQSLRSTEENKAILQSLDEDPECQVAVATVASANGLNVKSLLDSISLGFPETVDQLWQEKGRVGRNPDTVARGIVLYQPKARAAAEKQVASASLLSHHSGVSKSKRAPKTLEPQKARVLTEDTCYISAFNEIYQNPPLETSSLDYVAAGRHLPCSLCVARHGLQVDIPAPRLPPGVELPLFVDSSSPDPPSAAEKKFKLSKKERLRAEAELLVRVFFFDLLYTICAIRTERVLSANRNHPKSSYFPALLVGAVLNNLLVLDSLSKLESLLQSWAFASSYRARLYAVIHSLRATILSDRE
ncbi:P-loop containing nucleoside triphosphate hydrolase protein, partial [Roridomyces roridus]